MRSLVGSTIANVYSVTGLVGSGGMGTVYKGVHGRLNRQVAIKVLTAVAQDQARSDRFLAEARLQASLRHPGIATLYDFLDFEGHSYLVMEFVEGPTLAEHLQRSGPLDVAKATALMRQICEAVNYLHSQKIIHRDLKPANIKLLADGGVKLLDFGIARFSSSGMPKVGKDSAAATRVLAGTWEYMAPECLAGYAADLRSDIWSLGIVLHEMLTCHLPFAGTSLDELSRQAAQGFRPSSSSNTKQLSAGLRSVVSCCLQPSPANRYADVAALQRNLARQSRPAFLHKRHLRWYGAAAVAVLLLVFVLPWLRSAAHTATNNTVSGAKTIDVDVVNGPAEVYRNGRDLGPTPLRLDQRAGDHVALLLKREGFTDLPVDFDVDERSAYSYVMQESPAAH